ncbi:hypothetical protein HYPSUDRAFT_31893 [Hypholoma sublateritium FD-334 SS-4]|uniref:Chromate ion transporter n=1 Tax=Hypholoma sublateritium (strain FD-334 SS-4) TaxID=945553 RepID=A0A0D2QE50_HYPSF|nr:hypothetical protein HYPSUDRAFT_31893 [Hypholoma sublateritium FD-334 SS-4]
MSFMTLTSSVLRRLLHTRRPGDTNTSESVDHAVAYQPNTAPLLRRLLDVFWRTFDLGFTAFGGPPVHFQIFHQRFVDGRGKTPWIDEQTYQELFALSQALPGPASTKMLFNIAHIHAGIIPAMFAFFLWSFPGAVAMYGLSLAVEKIGETLPGPVYAVLSGVNAATVGIIALAAMQLARKAITDPLTRLLVVFGGCCGLCYNALWYLPVLLVFAGQVTMIWDMTGQRLQVKWRNRRRSRRRSARPPLEEQITEPEEGLPMGGMEQPSSRNSITSGSLRRQTAPPLAQGTTDEDAQRTTPVARTQPSRIDISAHNVPIKVGLSVITAFFTVFAVFMVLRGVLGHPPLLLKLCNNMILAGTIIFGGGPVVIPLLRDYVVAPGWVSPRDFLLGLAVIQAMPGPNFNFAVYLGALVLVGPKADKSLPTIIGSLLSFLSIFSPGLLLSIGFQSVWRTLRKRRAVLSVLRGVNAAAVGFVFTAVYRLWEIGFLTAEETTGISLGEEPWWLVIAAVTLTFVEWFSTPPPVAILMGGVAGIGWWGAVGRHLHA